MKIDQNLRTAISELDGVDFVEIRVNFVEKHATVEIIIIGTGFDRQDIAENFFNLARPGTRFIGWHTEVFRNIEYHWSEYQTMDDYARHE